jgi:phospholipase/carboxylesterase
MLEVKDFTYTFIRAPQQGPQNPTLLLLHGTGGNESELLPIGQMFGKQVNLLGVKGKVLENGRPRFFTRLAEGLFDLEDLQLRTTELKEFLEFTAQKYQFNLHSLIALGYSNGANIAGSLLLMYPGFLAGAILIRPMIPFLPGPDWQLPKTPVLILSGTLDSTMPLQMPQQWNDLLAQAGAKTTLHFEDEGHNLSQADIQFALEWFKMSAKKWKLA